MNRFSIAVTTFSPCEGSVDPLIIKRAADCEFFGKAEDGRDYAIKTLAKNVFGPAAEWLCYGLASACGVPVPACRILKMPNGEPEAFGSRWEGGVITNDSVIAQILAGGQPSARLEETFSAIYAFDLFAYNWDRRPENFLYCKARRDHYVVAFDFARCFTAGAWPMPMARLPDWGFTEAAYGAILPLRPFDLGAASAVLSRLAKIPASYVRELASSMPAAWMSDRGRNTLVKWWATEARSRADFVRRGLASGALLPKNDLRPLVTPRAVAAIS